MYDVPCYASLSVVVAVAVSLSVGWGRPAGRRDFDPVTAAQLRKVSVLGREEEISCPPSIIGLPARWMVSAQAPQRPGHAAVVSSCTPASSRVPLNATHPPSLFWSPDSA